MQPGLGAEDQRDESRKSKYDRLLAHELSSAFNVSMLKDATMKLVCKGILTQGAGQEIAAKVTSLDILIVLREALLAQTDNVDAEFVAVLEQVGLKQAAKIFRNQPTIDVVSSLRRQRAKEYKSYATVSLFEGFKPMPIDSIFVQLEFATHDGKNVDSYQKVVSQFLNLDDAAARKMMVISAQPGQGKTTLVKKICYDWSRVVIEGVVDDANEYIADVELLLVCSLREIRDDVKTILEMCAPLDAEHLQQLQKWIDENPSRFLVILDGFDELQPPTRYAQLNSLFFKLRSIPPFPIIVTSRPAALANKKHPFYRTKIRGLVLDELPDFVAKYCSSETRAAQVLEYIGENRDLVERLFRCPLLLAMLCALVERDALAKEFPKSQTDLYTRIWEWMLEVESEKYGTMAADEVFRALGQLAFEKTLSDDSRLVFDEDELKGDHFGVDVERAMRIGFLTCDSTSQQQQQQRRQLVPVPSKSPPRRFVFLHRTFQEFFAAWFASENPSQLRQFADRVQFKALISDQFLIFLAGFANGETPATVELLVEYLKAKGELTFQPFGRQAFSIRQRQQQFPNAVRSEELSYYSHFFADFCAQLHSEVQSDEILVERLAALSFDMIAKLEMDGVILLSALLSSGERFSLPRGYGGSIGFFRKSGYLFRAAILVEPISYVLISQASSRVDEGNAEWIALADLPKETKGFYFTGEVSAFLSLLRSTTFKLRIRVCTLEFRANAKIAITKRNVNEDATLVRARSIVEIADYGMLYLLCEENVDALQWAQLRSSILAKKLQWIFLSCRWDRWSASGEQTKAPCHPSSSTCSRNEDQLWSTMLLKVETLDFSALHSSEDLTAFFECIVAADGIILFDCALSRDTFLPSLLDWQRSVNSKVSTVGFINCTSSSPDSSIFEEAAKIVITIPSLEHLFFTACELSTNCEATIDALCATLEKDKHDHLLRRLSFEQCGNLHESTLARLREFGHHSKHVEFIGVDDEAIYEKFDSEGCTQLWYAANGGYPQAFDLPMSSSFLRSQIEKILGSTKAVMYDARIDRTTALFFASQNGDLETAKLLVGNKADVNATCKDDGATALHVASQNGHLEIVTLLVANKANVNAARNTGDSALWLSSLNGYIEIAKLLLSNKADVNSAHNSGATPLYVASANGHLEIAKLLVSNKADVNAALKDTGVTALMAASGSGHLEIVKLLVSNKADVNAARKNDGATPLHVASQNGHLEIAKLLVSNKADVNAARSNGATPLDVASASGHLEIAKLLVCNKANVNAAHKDDGATPLHLASQNGHLEIAKLLVYNKADVNVARKDDAATPLMAASWSGHFEIVKLLVSNKADVNAALKDDGATPLHFASQNGHLEIAKLLVSNQADVNAPCNNGATPLRAAIANGHLEIAGLLVSNKADLNAAFKHNGVTALFAASGNRHLEITKLLVSNKADVSVTRNTGDTPLYLASQNGHLEIAKLLVSNKEDVSAALKDDGTRPLIAASANGHLEISKLLFSNKADVNATLKDDGGTALLAASWNGYLEMAKLLVSNKADVNAVCKSVGATALYLATHNGHVELVKLLVSNKADVNAALKGDATTPLHVASQNGHLEIAKVLVSNQADVNAGVKDNGATPLYVASENGHLEIAKLLVSNKADVNAARNTGETPLNVASENGHLEIAKLLVSNNADVNAARNTGATPLYMASQNGHLEIAKLLVSNNADVNAARKNDGETPLMAASAKGYLEIVKLLIANKADVNKADKDGYAPVSIATQNGHVYVIRCLLSSSAMVDRKDKYGNTSLHDAARLGRLDVIGLLLDCGAGINAKNNGGKTSLMVAGDNGKADAVKYLISRGAI